MEVDPTTNTTGGVYIAISSVFTATEYTASFSIKGVDGVPYEAYLYVNGSQIGDAVEFVGDGTWRRYSVTAMTGGSSSGPRLYIRKNNDNDSDPFYIDAVQVEAKSYSTTYCDGDQDGCEWTAGKHSSTSYRLSTSSGGGKVVDLVSDVSGSKLGFNIRASVGTGMPPIELIDTLPAQSDGADHQRTITRPRQFQLVGTLTGSSWSDYLSRRSTLIDLVNHHRLPTDEPFELRYELDSQVVAIKARYEGGLEKGTSIGVSLEELSLRFKAQKDPFWYSVMGTGSGESGRQHGAVTATVHGSLSAFRVLNRGINGVWDNMDGGLSDGDVEVTQLVQGLDGKIYAAETAGAVGRARVYEWDGSSWTLIGGGTATEGANDIVGMVVAPDGGIIIATTETSNWESGGIGAVISWNGSSWSQVGTPPSTPTCLAIAPNGDLYGGFSGGALCKYDGSSWTSIASGDNVIECILVARSGRIWVGGRFTTFDSVSINRLAYSDDNGATWQGIASFNDRVDKIAFDKNGNLIIAGRYTSPYNLVSIWNGSTLIDMGGGLTGASGTPTARHIAVDENGLIYVGGSSFDTAGGSITLSDALAVWDSSKWIPVGVNLPGSAIIYSLLTIPTGGLYIGFSNFGTTITGEVNTASNNGKAKTYPIIEMSGPGRVYHIINYSTGHEIYFDLELEDGEIATLDLRPGNKAFISTFRDDIFSSILPGSDTESFYLTPGENNISIFCDNASASMSLRWGEKYWGFEGAVS
ncbi:MAG: hypothetical protein KDJ65_01765 [Anaerolineae bacterium]|nr:hypothetical protein [Anaerolineae bacterium]